MFSKQFGILDPACETLAELCSKSVDFSKNGSMCGPLLEIYRSLSGLIYSPGAY